MKMILEIDTISLDVKVVSRQDLQEEDIIKEINSYFNVDSSNKEDGKANNVVISRQFCIYFLREITGTQSGKIRELLGYSSPSSIISRSLHKLNDFLFDQRDPEYVRPYNNLARLFANYGIVIKPITIDHP